MSGRSRRSGSLGGPSRSDRGKPGPARPTVQPNPAPGTRKRLASAIAALPRRDRQVLALLLVEGMNELEAARALGIEAPMVRRGFVASIRKLHRVAESADSRGTPGRSHRAARLRRAS